MKIRTAILGYGRNGSTMHASAIEANDPFEMVAVCDIDPQRQKEAIERFSCMIYSDYHQMLQKELLDLVVIVTRSDQHCQMTCDCLAAGVNVLVTKPWAVNQTEAERMIAAAEASGKMLLPWLPARWGCDLRRLQELMAEKAIGNVFLVRRGVSTFGTRSDWQTERRYGGGYLLNWGAHIVDPPSVLMGSPVQSVYGRMKQTINPGDTEDVFMAILNLADGTLVQAEFTIATVDVPSWFIQGDGGTIVAYGRKLTIHKKTPAAPEAGSYRSTETPEDVIEEELEGEIYGDEKEVYAEIALAIRGEEPYSVTTADALHLSRVFDAIRISSIENRAIVL